ncbi:MAG: DUF4276 family protein [Bryobacterales bacterium]|nr:DUF4276 family protein [Bryobacterales bacterium]
MTVKLFVEGGGDRNKALDTECRRGFSEFIRKAGLEGRMPRVVACGGRNAAFDRFCTAFEKRAPGEIVLLLVDSEERPLSESSWSHVQQRKGDGWAPPSGASGEHLHFMVQAMEAWFFADPDSLASYFGKGFRPAALSRRANIEDIPKSELESSLAAATKDTIKGPYSKGDHSFAILSRLDPAKVSTASPGHAGIFLDLLRSVCTK